ncbi:sodium / potassium ATPase beta chain domain-containing protein [Phthorimaea operculella]|nr:sodium / potassium ATPase beta chain domain-containing protein [Phthorimaea operculella]
MMLTIDDTKPKWTLEKSLIAIVLVFYIVLALLFSCCFGVMMLTIDDTKPKWTLEKSLIGANPGVAYRPQPPDGFVVKYDKTNVTHYQHYIDQLTAFVKSTEVEGSSICSASDNFGFPDNPCFLIKLNKIYDWQPEYYDKGSLPDDMPDKMKEFINSETDPKKLKKIWVSCYEEKDNSTSIVYPWGRGFSSSYFPFRNQPGYRSPLVAVQFSPKVNQLTTIRCRAWAKNIVFNKSMKDPSGYTRIQLHIEDTTTKQVTEK